MSKKAKDQFIEQLKVAIKLADNILDGSVDRIIAQLGDEGGNYVSESTRCCVRLRGAIQRASGTNSPYTKELDTIDKSRSSAREASYRGVAESLLDDLEAGYTETVNELVHAEVFADYLGMAEHLLSAGYKDAAAVIIGSTLESHLRNLCRKHGLAVEQSTSNGPKPKKAETINADLCKAGAYDSVDQKNVTAWLGLRNKAAHGEYDKYTLEQVLAVLQSARDFIARHPA